VVIAESTRGLLGNLFGLKDLGTKDLKGVSEPVQTWAALRAKGTSLLHTGDIAGGRAHLERAIALYDPAVHRPLVPRFVHDIRVTALGFRSLALWLLGYPVASLADAAEALKEAREIGHAGSLMFALWMGFISVLCGDFLAAIAQADELLALAESKGTVFWKAGGMVLRGLAMAQTSDKALEAARMITSGLSAPTSATALQPFYLSYLATAYENLGRFDDARRGVRKATKIIETTKQVWCEAEVHRVTGEIALKPPEADVTKAQVYFERALRGACAAGKIMGTARRDEHGATLARSGQAGGGARASCSDLQLVH
jgi:tetratricopeptide (TPR) repeat protein